MEKKLTKKVIHSLHKTDVSDLLLSELRQAVAKYMYSEGCSCCRSDNHNENGERLAVLLGVEKYNDDSGYDWDKYRHQRPIIRG